MAAPLLDGFSEIDAEIAALAKALSHPARIVILRMLAKRDSCVCGDFVVELPLAQSTVSQHLKALKEVGLIRGEIDGPNVCYCLEPKRIKQLQRLLPKLLVELSTAKSVTSCC